MSSPIGSFPPRCPRCDGSAAPPWSSSCHVGASPLVVELSRRRLPLGRRTVTSAPPPWSSNCHVGGSVLVVELSRCALGCHQVGHGRAKNVTGGCTERAGSEAPMRACPWKDQLRRAQLWGASGPVGASGRSAGGRAPVVGRCGRRWDVRNPARLGAAPWGFVLSRSLSAGAGAGFRTPTRPALERVLALTRSAGTTTAQTNRSPLTHHPTTTDVGIDLAMPRVCHSSLTPRIRTSRATPSTLTSRRPRGGRNPTHDGLALHLD